MQNSHALEILDTKKGNTLKEDKLIELTTSLSSEVNSLQGIVQSLQQCLKVMKQRHEIHEKTFSPQTLHTIYALHTHLKELDFHISNFETSMMTSKYHDTSHMSKLGHGHTTRPSKSPLKNATI